MFNSVRTGESAARRGLATVYCVLLGVVPFAIVAIGFALSQTAWFVGHAGSTFLANVGYGTTLENADCPILIYGDSSALAGLDPAVIRQRTGLATCNIAEPANVTAVNGLAILDTYLAHNRPPRVILLDFAPDDFPPNWKTSLTEGILLRVRTQPTLSTIGLLAAHPEDTLRFATSVVRLSVQNRNKKPLPASAYDVRRSHAGYLPVPGKPLTNCSIYENQRSGKIQAPDPHWIADLRARYAAPGRLVLVNTTPLPDCDPDLDFFAARPMPTDNHLQSYPVAAFNGTGQLHMTRAGTIRFSTAVGDQIAARLAGQAGRKPAAATH